MENLKTYRVSFEGMRDRLLRLSVTGESLLYTHADKLLGCLGILLIASSVENLAHAQTGGGGASVYDAQIQDQVCKLLVMSQGYFGALVMSVAGLVALVSAALGRYSAAMNAIAVGAGAWLVRPMIFLFFGESAGNCAAFGFSAPTPG